MPTTIPLILAEATITLFATDINGNPILTRPIWVGARAENLQLVGDLQEVEASPTGAAFDEYAQLSEAHEITIERIWVLPVGPEAGPGASRMVDFQLQRGFFVMQIFGIEHKTGLWHQRTYYGVQTKRYGLRSQGVSYFGSDQVFRAQRYVQAKGSSGSSGTLTPIVGTGFEQPLLFTHDDPVPNGDYFIGFYQFSNDVVIGFTKAIANASQVSPTLLTLEIAGALTGNTLTLPASSPGTSVSASATFNVTVPAHSSIRWKVTSAPGSGLAVFAGITMVVKEP